MVNLNLKPNFLSQMIDPDLILLAIFGWDDLFIALFAATASSAVAGMGNKAKAPTPVKEKTPIKVGTLASTVPRTQSVRKKRKAFGGDDSPGGLLS
jgi:hypothetical protein